MGERWLVEQAESFGAWLKGERKRRRLTQQQLGQLVSYSADHIRKVEADERRFGDAQARLLAELTFVPSQEIDAFVGWARGGSPPSSFFLSPDTPVPGAPYPSAPERSILNAPLTDLLPVSPQTANMLRLSPTETYPTPARHWRVWLLSAMLVCVLLFGVAMMAYRQGRAATTGQIVPGGLWVSPAQHFVTQGDTVQFAARAYPTRAGDPAIAFVNFTVTWAGAHGDWQIACTVSSPVAGTVDEYACMWDRTQAQAPDGPIRVSFDVYDVQGHVNHAPNGIHEGTLQRAP